MENDPNVRAFKHKNVPGIELVEVHREGWEEVYGVLENTLKKIDTELREQNGKMVESINLCLEQITEAAIIQTPEEFLRKQQRAVEALLKLRKTVRRSLDLRLKSQLVRGRAQR